MILRALAIVLWLAGVASAEQLFIERFDDLAAWTGKNDGSHSGVVVADPIRAGNHVVTFTSLTTRGDIFSEEIPVARSHRYRIEFDYLGLPGRGVAGDLGGAIGLSDDLSFPGGQHVWLEATVDNADVQSATLVDNGTWRTYEVEFDPFDPNVLALPGRIQPFEPTNNTIRVIVEDFLDSRGVAGDAYFDNLRVLSAFAPCTPNDWLPGDANIDGTVDFGDFLSLSANFDMDGDWSQGDFNCDAVINFDDFLIVSEHFGDSNTTTTVDSVPEPSGFAIALAVACWGTYIRRYDD